jgi:hypothetical protein
MVVMMRTALALASIAAIAIACGSSSTSGSSGDGGTGSDGGNPDPCAGLGCASSPGVLTMHVVDASQSPVANPTFAESGHPLAPVCVNDGGFEIDAGASCDSWRFPFLSEGSHAIAVSAPGYATRTVTVTIQGPTGCCGQGPAVDEKVTLATGATDAGSDGD